MQPTAAQPAAPRTALQPLFLAPVVALGAIKLAIHLLTNGIYGYQRDELYYLASGRHPAFGYVDYPPVTPLLSRIDVFLLGESPWALRLFPAIAGAIIVVLVGVIARELGGGRNAQVLAGVAALACPMLLGANWLFQTVTFDQLAWTVALLFATRAIRRDDPHWWLVVGLAIGIGLETKLTIVALGVGLAAALVVTPARTHLRTPWPWLGAVIALAIFAPNFIWQATHGWATLDYTRNHSSSIHDDGGPASFLAGQLLVVGLTALPVWLLGWWSLFRDRDLRPVGVAAAVAFLIFLPGGKSYYPGPLIPVVLAAGCVRLEALARDRPRWWRSMRLAGAAMVIGTALVSPLLIPIVPTSSMADAGLDGLRTDYADTVGWPELASQVEQIYSGLPAAEREDSAILANNYGEAGALQRYGNGLPPVVSPQLNFWYWKPDALEPQTVIVIGLGETRLRTYYADVQKVASIPSTDGVDNEEVGVGIYICRQALMPFDAIWQQLKRFE